MKKITSMFFVLASMTMTAPAFAGAGHSHDEDGGHSQAIHSHGPINADKAKSKATHTMNNLAKRGVIDESWANTAVFMAEKKNFAKGEEWVVSFKNESIKDTTKQILYVFYSIDGKYIAANYTGK